MRTRLCTENINPNSQGKYQLVVSEKSWKTLKQKLKTITRKTTPCSVSERIHNLKEVKRGWINYFRMGSIYGKLKELVRWLHNRLRNCIWQDWKKPERKRENLIRLCIPCKKPTGGAEREWEDGQ